MFYLPQSNCLWYGLQQALLELMWTLTRAKAKKVLQLCINLSKTYLGQRMEGRMRVGVVLVVLFQFTIRGFLESPGGAQTRSSPHCLPSAPTWNGSCVKSVVAQVALTKKLRQIQKRWPLGEVMFASNLNSCLTEPFEKKKKKKKKAVPPTMRQPKRPFSRRRFNWDVRNASLPLQQKKKWVKFLEPFFFFFLFF